MIIENRIKKVESNKLIKEILIYIYLVNDGKVYDYQLNAVSPTFRRSLERYANELYHSGATPKMRLKNDENGLFYEVNDLAETNKKFYKFEDNKHTERLARVLTLAYLKAIHHPISTNRKDLEKFYFEHLNPSASLKTFSRDLKLLDIAYSFYK